MNGSADSSACGDEWGQIDVHRLAESGPTDAAPCALCGKPTRSHALADVGGTMHVLDARGTDADDILRAPPGSDLGIDVLCHGCLRGFDFPLADEERERFVEQARDFPMVEAVIE